jgi:hypothetical protein
MFPPQQSQGPPMGGMDPQMPAGASSPFAGGLGQDPSMAAPPQIDPALVQLLLMQLQADGLEGGMQPEAQAMIPLDPLAGMTGLSSQMPGMVPGMGGNAGMMGGMGGNLPPAFAQAQMLSQQRPQSMSSAPGMNAY